MRNFNGANTLRAVTLFTVLSIGASACVQGERQTTNAQSTNTPDTQALPANPIIPNLEQLTDDYESQLGIDLSRNPTYLAGTRLSQSQLQADLKSRTKNITVTDANLIKSAGDNVLFHPSGTELFYSQPNTSSSIPSWVITRKDGNGSTVTHLPIAKISTGSNGTLTITDQRPPLERANQSRQVEYDKLVTNAVQPTSGLIQLAMKTGGLKDVSIVYSDKTVTDEDAYGAESSSYDDATKEETIVIPKSGYAPLKNILSDITHETGHSIFGQAPLSEISPEIDRTQLASQLRKACAELKASVFTEAAADFKSLIPIYERLQKVTPASQDEIAYIIEQINKNNYGSVQYKTGQTDFTLNDFPECFVTNANAMIGYTRTIILRSTNPSEKLSPEALNISAELKETFSKILRSTAIMKTVAEHGYTNNTSDGHPEDGIEEGAASVFNIALNYPETFKRKVDNDLSPSAAQALKLLYNTVRKTYIAQAPDLISVFPDLFPS